MAYISADITYNFNDKGIIYSLSCETGSMMKILIMSLLSVWASLMVAALVQGQDTAVSYSPTWESLDSRPNPDWYDEAKLGIFIHWGVMSVPSYSSEWFWWQWKGYGEQKVVDYMNKYYPPDFTYGDFAPKFTAEFFSASEWAKLFVDSGAKYIVFTSKHHDGYTNWPSEYSYMWNSQSIGPIRDLVGELEAAIKNETSLKFGLYHSLMEWFHPLYIRDRNNNFTTKDFPTTKSMPELYELVTRYKPDIVWSDGEWESPSAYWNSTDFLAWLYNDSPVKDTVVTNDRWGMDVICKHGGVYTCHDRFNPGYLIPHKWENALTIDWASWAYRRDADVENYMSIENILWQLISTISCNGNVLLNVGPTFEGKVAAIYQERLKQLGSWLKVNGEAVYGSRPWKHQNDTVTSDVWYTQNNKTDPAVVYVFLLFWPKSSTLELGAPIPSSSTQVTLVGYNGPAFSWTAHPSSGISISFPAINYNDMPCHWAWVLKLTDLKSFQ